MEHGATHVDVVPIAAMQQHEGPDVHHQAGDGDEQHGACQHGLGIFDPLDRLPRPAYLCRPATVDLGDCSMCGTEDPPC